MERDPEMLERIAALEQEVRSLKTEVQHLKKHVKIEQIVPIKNEPVKPFVRKNLPLPSTVAVPKEDPIPEKEKRSLEELFTRALPRIFTVILVLGVLWGLKLVSDYGFLSDSVKIIAGFVLSIGLGACAYYMEKKEKGSRVVALSLYGGAFIVGILTTAAGAILYDVLSLYVALIFALIYIVYGVFISYVKGNEALTALVVFTSLLLPYLLEYMQFSGIIIGIFVVLLFAVVQVVILKHTQRRALYIGTAFSVLALAVVSIFHDERLVFFAFAIIAVFSLFLLSFLRLYSSNSKLHASLLFTFTVIILSLINGILSQEETPLLIALVLFFAILASALYIVFKRTDRLMIDMFGTLSAIVLLNIITQLNISSELSLLLMIVVAFGGLVVAVKHAILFMKWVKGITFSVLAFFVLMFYEVEPFFSLRHLNIVLVIAMLAVLYKVLLQYKAAPVEEKKRLFKLEDIYPCLLYLIALLYVWKLDWAYMPQHYTTFLAYGVIAFAFAAVLVVKREIVGKFLPWLAFGVYVFAGLVLLSTVWVDDQAVLVALIVRILYFAILWAIVADAWEQGWIYKNYTTFFSQNTEKLTISSMIISIIWIFSITNFMNFHDLLNWSSAVILNTVFIFIFACLSLFLAAKRSYSNLKMVGIGLLFFGIIKMIFFDLSELDILIRSISFIIIGAIGLVISNKLLGKGKDE
ncbi:DUF2339 domain-containing protein [Solibacillus isronensis]|uniref:DUF2339 domain-containing protein n=1 Tax=Solibacillus isronensis TaxID=412383 RepID=UPI0009A8E5E8|nr:DUF2339 domain-containing protein [Solibacillus isronensis]